MSQSTPQWYDPNLPLESAVKHVASLSNRFNWVGVYLLQGANLVLGPFVGEDTDHKIIPVGRGVCGTAVATGEDQVVPDVSSVSNYLSCSIKTKSELVILIRKKSGEIVGQIDIDSHTSHAFGENEVKEVKKVAEDLGNLWHA